MGEIFRKKSLDKVNFPEDLNEYMRVTNPPVWFALIVVVLLLFGAIIWGTSAKLETKAQALAIGSDEGIVCYISESDISAVKEGTVVRIGKAEYSVISIETQKSPAETILSDYEMQLAGFVQGEAVYCVKLDGSSTFTGSCKADVIVEEILPISFLLESNG